MATIRAVVPPDFEVICSPNRGEAWDAVAKEWRETRHSAQLAAGVAAAVGEWCDAGASVVGGCCRVGPDQIAQMAAALAARGPARERRQQTGECD